MSRLRRELRLPLPERGELTTLAALAAFVLALFPRLLAGEALFNRDIHQVWYPVLSAAVASLASGSWPLWDPYRGFGQPLLADPSAQLAYPPTWLNLLLSPHAYYRAFAVGHLILAAWGTYRLARRLGQSRLAGSLAGLAWAGSGPLVSAADLYHHLAGAAWAPWVLLRVDRLLEAPGRRQALALAGVLALQVLAGSGDMLIFTAIAAAVGVAAPRITWRRPSAGRWPRPLAALALAATLAAGLSAVQWLPTLEAAQRSARRVLFEERDRTAWSFHPLGLLEVALPFRWADLPQLTPDVRDTFDLQATFLRSVHLGIPLLALLPAAFLRPDRRRWLLLGLGLGALLVALGRHAPVYRVVVALLPPLAAVRYPVKALLLASFAGALLAGWGLDAWRSAADVPARRWRALVVVPALTLAVAAVAAATLLLVAPEASGAALLPAWAGPPGYREVLRPVARQLAAGAGFAALAAVLAWRAPRSRRAALAQLALVAGSLLFAHSGLHATVPSEFFALRPPVLETLLRDERHPRVYVYDYSDEARKRSEGLASKPFGYRLRALPPGWTTEQAFAAAYQSILQPPLPGRWGVRGSFDLDGLGFHPLYLAQLVEYLRYVEPTPGHLRLLQAGAVDYALALLPEPWWRELDLVETLPGLFTEPLRVLRVPEPAPRARVVGRARRLDGDAALAELAGGRSDPRTEVLLADGPPLETPGSWSGRSRIVDDRPDRVRVEVSASGPGFLVLVDAYDPGWRARVDGEPAPLYRADVAFRAVPVPAGEHVVELVYRPRAALVGASLTGLSLLGMLLLVLVSPSRRGASPAAAPGVAADGGTAQRSGSTPR